MEAKYIEQRNELYYYRRRIPQDVRHKYPNRASTDFRSLKTRNPKEAARKAHLIALEQGALWAAWRDGNELTPKATADSAHEILRAFKLKPGQAEEYRQNDIEPDEFIHELIHKSDADGDIVRDNLPEDLKLAGDLFYGAKLAPHLSDVVAEYEALKSSRAAPKARSDRQRVLNELYAVAGDLPVDQYTRQHANALVERLVRKGNKSATIQRNINQIAPVMAFAIREEELEAKNVFERLNIPDRGENSSKRFPFVERQPRWPLPSAKMAGSGRCDWIG